MKIANLNRENLQPLIEGMEFGKYKSETSKLSNLIYSKTT